MISHLYEFFGVEFKRDATNKDQYRFVIVMYMYYIRHDWFVLKFEILEIRSAEPKG